MTEPLYSGEAICKRWGDSSTAGRTVTLQLEDGGEHPFRGYEGERFAIVVVPIGNDDKPMKKIMGGVSAASQGAAPAKIGKADEPSPSTPKPKKRWHEMPASQRAALLVKDAEFQRYATECYAGDVEAQFNEPNADNWLKFACGIASKSSILPGTTAHERFVHLEGNFLAWRQAKQHGAA